MQNKQWTDFCTVWRICYSKRSIRIWGGVPSLIAWHRRNGFSVVATEQRLKCFSRCRFVAFAHENDKIQAISYAANLPLRAVFIWFIHNIHLFVHFLLPFYYHFITWLPFRCSIHIIIRDLHILFDRIPIKFLWAFDYDECRCTSGTSHFHSFHLQAHRQMIQAFCRHIFETVEADK